jgi:threonine aldolase
MAARLLGKEARPLRPLRDLRQPARLFTHCERGTEVILDEGSHILQHEAASPAVIASVQLRPVPTARGMLGPADLEGRFRDPEDYHQRALRSSAWRTPIPTARVFCLSAMDEVRSFADRVECPSTWTGRASSTRGRPRLRGEGHRRTGRFGVFCLSKGLCAACGFPSLRKRLLHRPSAPQAQGHGGADAPGGWSWPPAASSPWRKCGRA